MGRKWRRQERSQFFLLSACAFSHHDNTESANHAVSTWPRNKLTDMSLRIWGQDYSCCASELGSQFTAFLLEACVWIRKAYPPRKRPVAFWPELKITIRTYLN